MLKKKKVSKRKKQFNRGKERFKVDKWTLKTLPINSNEYIKLDLNIGLKAKTNDLTKMPYYRKSQNTKVIRAKIVPMEVEPLTAFQLMQWAVIYRYIYNLSIGYLYKHGFKPSNMNLTHFRSNIKTLISDDIRSMIERYKFPAHVIENPFRDITHNFKSAEANRKAGNIKFFKLRRIKESCKRYTMNIDAQYFRKTGNCITGLGEVITGEPIKSIRKWNRECKIQIQVNDRHDPSRNKFVILVPKNKQVKVKLEARTEPRIAALDPGQRTFQTVYSKEGITHVGYGNNDHSYINKKGNRVTIRCALNKKIKRLERLHKLAFNDGIGTIVHTKSGAKPNAKPKAKSVYRKAYTKYSIKIKNWIKDMHRKTALWLCKNFNVIYVGKLSIQEVTAKEGNLYKDVKKTILALSHHKFKIILMDKAKEWGVQVKYVSEAYTSQTCGRCGELNKKLKASKHFKCPSCNFECDRDVNGARNIYIKNML